MNVSSKSFNWIRTYTPWEQSQIWREKQRQAREDFESSNSTVSSTFLNVSQSLAVGLGRIAAQRAYDRVQAKIKAAAVNKQA
jgi:hypothetical protein